MTREKRDEQNSVKKGVQNTWVIKPIVCRLLLLIVVFERASQIITCH